MADTAYIVVTDNGDTEPELHGFWSGAKADDFATARGASSVEAISILSDADADHLIATEKAGL